MRFKGLDLNLLVALDAVMTERNLTAAARQADFRRPILVDHWRQVLAN